MTRALWSASALFWALQFSVLNPILAALLVSLYGATVSEVGLSLVVYNVGGFLASLIVPGLADRARNYVLPLLACSICGVGLTAALSFTTSLPVAVIALLVLGGPAGVGSALVFAHLHHRGASPARVIRTRAIVSVAWVVGPPLASVSISGDDDRGALFVLAAIALTNVATSLVLVRGERARAEVEGPRRMPVLAQLRGWGRWGTISAFVVLHATNLATVSTLALFVANELHAPVMWAGIILGTCALLEVPSLILIGHLLPRFGPRVLLLVACGVGVLYYALAAMVSAPWHLLVLQVLNAWFFATVAGVGLTVFQTLFPSPGLAVGLFTNTRRVGAVLSGVLIAGGDPSVERLSSGVRRLRSPRRDHPSARVRFDIVRSCARDRSRCLIMDEPGPAELSVPWSEILAATGAMGTTDITEALTSCWARTRSSDIAQRCVLAHYLADHQPTAQKSLLWDLRALNHGRRLASDALTEVGIADVARILPSLHLNVAASYRRIGELQRARLHARKAQAAVARMRRSGGPTVDHPLDAATERAIERLLADLASGPGSDI